MSKLGLKVKPNICPICDEIKATGDFEKNIVCRECRVRDPFCDSQFYGKPPRRPTIFNGLRRIFERRILRRKEVNGMPEDRTKAYLKFPERVAAIIGKTAEVRGFEDAKLLDDEAITRIRDLLDELDPTLIRRNKDKRLSRG